MIEKKQSATKPLLEVNQICLILKFNQVIVSHVTKKYKGKQLSESDWRALFKKDGLNF